MSNERFTYKSAYSSGSSHRQAPQSIHPEGYQAHNISSSTPYYGSQVAASAGNYAAADYQSERYPQHQQSSSEAHFSWYGASAGVDGEGQEQEIGERDNIKAGQPESNSGLNNKLSYSGSNTGSYAYSSALNFPPHHGVLHEETVRFPNRGANASGRSNEGINIRIPYQPYSRSFEQSNIRFNSSQQERGYNEVRGTTEHALGAQSYMSQSQPSRNPTPTAGSYSNYSSNIAIPRSNVASTDNTLGNAEFAVRQKTQDNFPQRYDSAKDQSLRAQAFQDQQNQVVRPRPQAAEARKLQNTTRTTQRRSIKTPPSSHAQPPRISILHENVTKSIEPRRNQFVSTSKSPTNDTQLAHQLASGHRFNDLETSQDQRANPPVSGYPATSSIFRSETVKDKSSTISEGSLVDLRPRSPNVQITVDPSQVYNQYHEYQRQIEAVDAEHARLAALKLEREAAEAAAAAIASAKALSRTMDSARLQLENERLHQVHRNMQIPNDPASNTPTLSNLTPVGQTSSRGFTGMPPTGPVLHRELPTVDPQKVAAMEEEVRLMVEKIREYRTHDPQLFAQVWESVKSKRASIPVEAQLPAGEDLLRTSIKSQMNQGTNPVSLTAQHRSQPVAISYPAEGKRILANPPMKLNGRSNAANTEKAVERSQKPTARARKRANIDADIVPNEVRNSFPKPQETHSEPLHTCQKSPETLGTLIKPSTTSSTEHVDPPDSVLHSLTSSGLLNQVPTASQGIPKTNQSTTTDLNHIDSAILRESAQRAQSAVETMNKNSSTEQSTGSDLTQNSVPTYNERKSGVVWPEEQRNTIANTAAKTLNALPENARRKIAAFQILDMLGYNPSYIELCKLIESIGFKFDRARFAKTLLAAMSGVNSCPPQPAKPEISQSPISPSPSRENNEMTSDPYNVAQSSCNTGNSRVTHEQTQTLSGDAIAPLANNCSQIEVGKVKRMPGGRRSRGPYRKTIERMAAMQNNPSSSEGQRGRQIKHPRMTPVSDDHLDRNYPVGPSPLEKHKSIESGALGPTIQAPLVATGSYKSGSIEERLLVALKGGVPDETNVLASGHNHAVTKPAGLPTSASILQTQSTPLAGQSITGWRGHTVSSPPPGVVDKDANTRPTTKKSPAITPTFTKEMAARKRTFTEIIDLTSSDTPALIEDDSQTARKARRVDGTNFEMEDYYVAAQEPKTPNNSSKHRQSGLTATKVTTSLTPLPNIPQSEVLNQPRLATAPLLPNPYKSFNDIVKPIDKSVALRKSRYDPKTIARDILITTAQHLFQRGLNAHLEPLQTRFAKVDGSADLSTFRWDIVDPGGPSVGSANMSSISEEIWKETPNSKDSDPSSGKHLDSIELPVHRGPLKPTRGGASFRGRAGRSLMGTQARQLAQPSGLRYSSTADSEIAVVIESAAAQVSPNTVPTARGRSRSSINSAVASQLNPPLRKRIGRPPKDLSRENNIRGKSSGRQVGRARTHTVSKSKPTGRPRKSGSKIATPKFTPFLCEWKDCKAELHNLETLKRHVYSVHNKVLASGAIACQWAKCGLNRQVNDESKPISTAKSTPEPRFIHEYHEFGNIQLFTDHMEKAHLTPFAWYMGDGPRGSTLDGSESDVSDYPDDDDPVHPFTSLHGDEEDGGESSWASMSRRALDRPYDPALESPVELATPEMKANFTMGTEWKTINALPQDE